MRFSRLRGAHGRPAHVPSTSSSAVSGAGRLTEPTSGVSLDVPPGWVLTQAGGDATCHSPTAAQADATGRHLVSELRIAPWRQRGWSVAAAPRTLDEQFAVAARDVVSVAVGDDARAWLIDACRWTIQATDGAFRPGIRLDLTYHDRTTPLAVTILMVMARTGVVTVTASVPVSQQRAAVHLIEAALATVRIDTETAGSEAALGSAPTSWLGDLSGAHRFIPPVASISHDDLAVFVRGSHKLAPAMRPGPRQAGLIDASGTATPMGRLVRQAMHRPDVRYVATVVQSGDPGDARIAEMVVDRVGPWAVVHATPPAGRNPERQFAGWIGQSPTAPRADQEYIEVIDCAASPARVAAWLGVGPGTAIRVQPGCVVSERVVRTRLPGQPPAIVESVLSENMPPLEVWHRIVAGVS
jgi:hypothetical protein